MPLYPDSVGRGITPSGDAEYTVIRWAGDDGVWHEANALTNEQLASADQVVIELEYPDGEKEHRTFRGPIPYTGDYDFDIDDIIDYWIQIKSL